MTFQVNRPLLTQFESDGFVIVRQLFSIAETNSLLLNAKTDQQLISEAYVRKDGEGGESRLAVRNELADSPYSAIVRSQRVAGSISQFLGDEVYHYHHKMMLKEAKVGGAWQWHQDYGYWYNNGCLFPDMGSCLIAVDQANRTNGCLQVVRGSHKLGRINHDKVGDQMGIDRDRIDAVLKRMELIYCELEPGDAIFFHGNLLHRSDANTSENPRWSLICCYNTRHNDPYVQGGHHPNYEPLEIWSDDQVTNILLGQSTAPRV